jgi:hypothetical protein
MKNQIIFIRFIVEYAYPLYGIIVLNIGLNYLYTWLNFNVF